MGIIRKAIIIFVITAMSLMPEAVVSAETAKTLTVSGNGTIKAAPDIAYLNVGVRTSDKDAEAASQQNNHTTEAIVAALKAAGIDEKDVKTQYYYVNPMYDYSSSERGESVITGYEVSNSLNITIRKIDDAGKIIDVCISAGANMVNGLSYSVETPSDYYDSLFERAVADANRKSTSIAKALGVGLSKPLSVSEGSSVNAIPAYVNVNADMKMSAGSAMAATYTAPGDIDLYASIVIVYEYE